MDPREQVGQIRALFDDAHPDEAAGALADLWREMADPAWRPMRGSLLAGLLTRAASSGPAARRHVETLRQEGAPPQGPEPADHLTVREWCALNIALGQADRTLSWLDRVESDPAALESLRPLAGFIPYILRQAGRWPDMARWFPDPVRAVRHAYAAADTWLARLDSDSGHLSATIRAFARDRAALVYASMLAAGREEAALAAAATALALDAEPTRLRTSLVRVAVQDAGEAREHQLAWLDSTADRGEQVMELREKVVAALQAPKAE